MLNGILTVNMEYSSFISVVLICTATSLNLSYSNEGVSLTNLQRLVSIATKQSLSTIVYDEWNDTGTPLSRMMEDFKQFVWMYEYETFYSFIKHHMKRVMENSTTLSQLRNNLNFMLICENTSVEDIMIQVSDFDNTIGQRSLLRHFSTWVIISPDAPPKLNITVDNVAMIRIPPVYEEHKRHGTMTSMLYSLKDKNIKRYSGIEVHTLLWVPDGREWSRVHLSDMSRDELYNSVFPNTLLGLNGRQLRLVTLEWPPYTERHISNGKLHYTGAGLDIIGILGRTYNFSFVVVEPEDMLWGQEEENGHWTGVLGMVARAEADTCPAAFGISLGRKKVMDFSFPVSSTEYSALYRKRHYDTKSWLHFFSSFSWPVTACILSSLLMASCLYVFIHKQSMGGDTLSLFETGVRITLHQDILFLSKDASGRILTFACCIFCLMTTAVFTGNLVATAAVEKYSPPFSTLQELAEQNDYAVGVFEGGYAENVLMTSEDPLLKTIYRKVTASRTPGTKSTENVVNDAIQRVLDEKYVLIATDSIKDLARSKSCDVIQMREKLFPIHSAFPFPKHSALKKLFNEQFLFFRESGIMNKLEKNRNPRPKECNPHVHVPKFKLDNLKTILVLAAVCVVMAAVVLLVEILKKRSKRRSQQGN